MNVVNSRLMTGRRVIMEDGDSECHFHKVYPAPR